MLLLALLDFVAKVLSVIFSIIPDVQSLPAGVDSAFDLLFGYTGQFVATFPFLVTFFQVALLSLVVQQRFLLFKAINWAYNKLFHAG